MLQCGECASDYNSFVPSASSVPPVPARPQSTMYTHKPCQVQNPEDKPSPPLPPKPGRSQSLPRRTTLLASTGVHYSPSRPATVANLPPDIDIRPPMPLPHQLAPPPKLLVPVRIRHPTTPTFLQTSGWYKPSVEQVVSDKLHSKLQSFKNLHSGIFVFQCKEPPQMAYVGKSKALRTDLTELIRGLTEKNDTSFNTLEEELRFHYPYAKQWNVRAWEYPVDQTNLEQAKLIIKLRSLKPCGLNTELEWFSREEFDAFCQWYTQYRVTAGIPRTLSITSSTNTTSTATSRGSVSSSSVGGPFSN